MQWLSKMETIENCAVEIEYLTILKLTPLNIVSSIALVTGMMLFIKPAAILGVQQQVNGLLAGFCILTAIIAFISDLLLRKFIPLLGKLWIVEGVLIVFTVALLLILKSAIA